MSECNSVASLQRLIYALAERVAAQSELLSKRAEKMGIGYDLQDAKTHTNANGGKQSDIPFRCDLLPAAEILDIARVLKQGANKYGPDNWKKISTDEHMNHAITHGLAWLAGDTSEDHLSHFVCRGLFAMHTAKVEAASGIDPIVARAKIESDALGPKGSSVE